MPRLSNFQLALTNNLRRLWALGGGSLAGFNYLLQEDYLDTLAGGAVNGTLATPGGKGTVAQNTRVDTTTGEVSIGTGAANWAAGAVDGSEHLGYGSYPRMAGRLLLVRVNKNAPGLGRASFGLFTAVGVGALASGIMVSSITNVRALDNQNPNTVTGPIIGAVTLGTFEEFAVIMGLAGVYLFQKVTGLWKFLWKTGTGSAALFPVQTCNVVTNYDKFYVPDVLWLPTAALYDTFARANGNLGSSEIVGPDGQAANKRIYLGGVTWQIDTNQAKNTPATFGFTTVLDGDMELAGVANWADYVTPVVKAKSLVQAHSPVQSLEIQTNATPEGAQQAVGGVLGTWYKISAWFWVTAGSVKLFTAGGHIGNHGTGSAAAAAWTQLRLTTRKLAGNISIFLTSTVAASTFFVDDVESVALMFTELINPVEFSTPDVYAKVAITAVISTTQGGLILRLDDKDNPLNYILVYLTDSDGSTSVSRFVYLDKVINGVYTPIMNGLVNYAAGADLEVFCDGANISVYYNKIQVGATQVIADAEILSNTLHGTFSTDETNRLDNLTIIPIGNEGQHAILTKMMEGA